MHRSLEVLLPNPGRGLTTDVKVNQWAGKVTLQPFKDSLLTVSHQREQMLGSRRGMYAYLSRNCSTGFQFHGRRGPHDLHSLPSPAPERGKPSNPQTPVREPWNGAEKLAHAIPFPFFAAAAAPSPTQPTRLSAPARGEWGRDKA